MSLSILAMIAFGASAGGMSSPERVSLVRLSFSPERYLGKIVVTCGMPSRYEANVLVEDDAPGIAFDPAIPRWKEKAEICLKGRVERIDGLTAKEIIDRKLPLTVYTHVRNPEYVIRPVDGTPVTSGPRRLRVASSGSVT